MGEVPLYTHYAALSRSTLSTAARLGTPEPLPRVLARYLPDVLAILNQTLDGFECLVQEARLAPLQRHWLGTLEKPPPPPARGPLISARSLTHTLRLSLTRTHSVSLALSYTLSHTHTRSLSLSLIHTVSHTLGLSLSLSHIRAYTGAHGQRTRIP